MFDITNIEEFWLCKEDEDLYKMQVESQRSIGYTTSKTAPKSSIHPSKRPRVAAEVTHGSMTVDLKRFFDDSSSESTDGFSSEYAVEDQAPKRKYENVKFASILLSKFLLSRRLASRVRTKLAHDGVELPTPTQTAIWRRVIENGKTKAKTIEHILQNEHNFRLHFDGKRIRKKEYQVICLTSPTRIISLSIVCCASGSSKCIFTATRKTLDEFDGWSSIKMIVCDTTSVNTGRKNGVVARLQREFEDE